MRPTGRPPLAVWLYGTRIALLHDFGSRYSFVWEAAASARWGLRSRVVGTLMEIERDGVEAPNARVRAFLNGLLPEANQRTHYAHAAGVDPQDVFGLLAAYGLDTAGALVFRDAGTSVPDGRGLLTPVDDHAIEELLRNAGRYGAGSFTPTSLAGVQPKIALLREGGVWYRCHGAPTTHILKLGAPAGTTLSDVIDTEAACLALARALRLTTVEAAVHSFGDLRALVVSRYDRTRDEAGTVHRLHQEDAAQALGLDTSDLERKFQRGRALPSLLAIADALQRGGTEPDELLRLTVFNLCIGNTDAHAKNISILRPATGRASLAPAYDVAMHGHHGGTDRFAMQIDGKDLVAEITADDLSREAQTWGLSRRRAARLIRQTLDGLESALRSIDTSAHPGVSPAAWAATRRSTRRLATEAASWP